MQNANQIHEFIKLVYQYNLDWLLKLLNFNPTPKMIFFFQMLW